MITAEGYEGFFRNDNEVLGFWPIFPGCNSRQWVLEKSDSRKTYTSFDKKTYMFSQKHVRLFSTTSNHFYDILPDGFRRHCLSYVISQSLYQSKHVSWPDLL